MAEVNLQDRMETPLQGASYESLSVDIKEQKSCGKLTLRGNAEDAKFRTAIKSILGESPPQTPLTSIPLFLEENGKKPAKANGTLIWIAFDEWMIWYPRTLSGKIEADLKESLAGQHAAVVEVGDYYTILELSGPRARDLLRKGLPLDLHESAFPVGMAAASHFQQAAILLVRAADKKANKQNSVPCFSVQIRWSFARYLWDYFTDGAKEWAKKE